MTERISTPFTDLLGIKYPIVQAGMSWVSSCADLPVAVSEAGGLGVVAAGPVRTSDLSGLLNEVRTRTSRPWAVNLPLYRKDAEEAQKIILDFAPQVLIASQGGPKQYLSKFHAVGTKCFHVVASVAHAQKAADAGVDGLIVVGGEAGGHPPTSMVSTLVLTRAIASALPGIPIVASGGFADGNGLAAALALGASAAQFGTKFIASEEARVHPDYQQMILNAGVEDTYTVGKDLGMIRCIGNEFTNRMSTLEASGAPLEERRNVFAATVLREAVLDGHVAGGKVEAGQSVGLVKKVERASEIVGAIVQEYRQAVAGLPR